MIVPDLLPQILETARWLIVRVFIFMGLLSLFPTILVLLLEPIIIAMRSMNNRTPSSSTATSRATTPSSSRAPSRSPSVSRRRTPQPSAPASAAASPMLRDYPSSKQKENKIASAAAVTVSGADNGKQGFALPVPAVVVNPASVSNIVGGLGSGGGVVTHRKVNPGALAASLPSSPQLSSF